MRERVIADLQGKRFERIVVLHYVGYEYGCHKWRVRCDCGCEFTTNQKSLIYGGTRSCGCLRNEKASATSIARTGKLRGPYNTKHHTGIYKHLNKSNKVQLCQNNQQPLLL